MLLMLLSSIYLCWSLWCFKIVIFLRYQYLVCFHLHSYTEYSTFGYRNIPPGRFHPGCFPPEHSPHEKYAWKQRCLALREICRWHEPVPTRVLNPNASEASFKLKQRSYRKTWGGGSIPRTIFLCEAISLYNAIFFMPSHFFSAKTSYFLQQTSTK